MILGEKMTKKEQEAQFMMVNIMIIALFSIVSVTGVVLLFFQA
jgi:hypothetical protein